MCMLNMLNDSYDVKDYIQTTSVLPFWKKAIIFLLKPFTAVYALLWFAAWNPDSNCIKPKGEIKLDGLKKNAICKPFHVPTMKKIAAKLNKATINDLVLGLASVSLKKYMMKHGDPDQKTINMVIPFSMREIPQTPAELKMCNDFTGLGFELDLSTKLSEATAMIKIRTRKLKNSLYPHGLRAVGELSSLIPCIIGQLII